MAERKKEPLIRKSGRMLAGLALLGATANWWRASTNDFSQWDRSKPDAALTFCDDPDYLKRRTQDARECFARIIRSHAACDKREFTPEETALITGKIDKYEMIAEKTGEGGFHGVAFREKEFGNIVVVFSSGNANTAGEFAKDLDDIFMSTSGAPIGQLKEAKAFADEIKTRYGRIDEFAGHSIGGYMALYLTGMGQYGHANCVTFDSPGVTNAMITNCAEMSGRAREEILDDFQSLCTSVTITPNAYNRLGTQPGEYLSFDNTPISPLNPLPRKHLHTEFVNKFNEGSDMMHGTNEGTSGGPPAITMSFLTLAMLCFAHELKALPRAVLNNSRSQRNR